MLESFLLLGLGAFFLCFWFLERGKNKGERNLLFEAIFYTLGWSFLLFAFLIPEMVVLEDGSVHYFVNNSLTSVGAAFTYLYGAMLTLYYVMLVRKVMGW